MPVECRPIGVLLHVPEPNGVVEAGACQGPSVRTPSHRLDPISMSDQRLADASTGNIPELDRLVPACAGKLAPVGEKASPIPQLVCPTRIATQVAGPLCCLFQSLICPSKPRLASRCPSGLQVMVKTA